MKTSKSARSQDKWTRNKIFGLTRQDVKRRRACRTFIILSGCLILAVFIGILITSESSENKNRNWFVTISIIKYTALIFVAYFQGRKLAANYLDDLYELKDLKMATAFIEDISFGNGENRIAIAEGKIPQKEEKSPVLLIGGPGEIMVHLGNVILMERADGNPRVLATKSQAWEIEGFERIREIGQYDDAEKHEYAIINLRNQFVRGLSLKTRTKDSILVEIKGIKVMFSILRDSDHANGQNNGRNPFTFDEDAIHALIYNQAVITQPHETMTGIKFPWDTTVIPLLIGELEKLIQNHTLSEILTSIGTKEREDLAAREEELKTIRGEMNRDSRELHKENANSQPTFIPRTTITERFFGDEFRQKAAELGIMIEWIDIGTWEINQTFVLDKLKEAREISLQNAKYEREITKNEEKLTFDKIHEMINKVVTSNFKQSFDIPALSPSEWKKLAETLRSNPELADPYLVRLLYRQMVTDKSSQLLALNMLKAFSSELLAAREIINKEVTSPVEREGELRKINNALNCINKHLYHMLGGK
ncbi:MAG: hypothetical protein HYZ21_15400 [Chloroflexi bacterium]|nr:hypothetical protein [Chloroflexota bacterium]